MNGSKPLIGIPCRHDVSTIYAKDPVNAQGDKYLRVISQAGGIPLLIPLNLEMPALRTLYDLAAGILLPGGGDIEPALYQQSTRHELSDVQPDRDQTEIVLSRWAAEEGKPLLGICRGIQVIAVAAGGTVCQDLPTERPEATLHRYDYLGEGEDRWHYMAHEVELNPASRLCHILQTERLWVNSLHHQAVESVPAPLHIAGCSSDGVAEAIELPGHPFYCAVQWHPEVLTGEDEFARQLFRAFVEACMRT
jgi:putative glutamine amidotransferase